MKLSGTIGMVLTAAAVTAEPVYPAAAVKAPFAKKAETARKENPAAPEFLYDQIRCGNKSLKFSDKGKLVFYLDGRPLFSVER